jgi:hypothetical protein
MAETALFAVRELPLLLGTSELTLKGNLDLPRAGLSAGLGHSDTPIGMRGRVAGDYRGKRVPQKVACPLARL